MMNNNQFKAVIRKRAFAPGSGRTCRQQGFVLILALVMLSVLTLIGVSSMNSANIELKSTANAQQHQIAFNADQALLEYSVSKPVVNAKGINYKNNNPDADDQVFEPDAETLNLSEIQSLKATVKLSGCAVAIGNSLENGKGFSFSYFTINGVATNKTGTASSIQAQAVRYPAAGCT